MLLKNLHRHFCGGELYSLWLLITSLKIISRSSRLQTGGVDVEQGGKIVGGLLSQLLKRHPLQYRHILGNVTDQRRLVLFAAVGDRRQVRRVGFNQQAIQRHVARRITQLLGVTKSDDTGNEI
ncbi:Uncharacterised protein [Klebsiella pneumoniae]|uniref:Uncharacterized protein n=1 Tax=Klebsiella pneumoniae TaxID=573 RepID=A0A2X1QNL1_KLEPN|nr:Uncharacterised protein [Klebsiella pneumoniae]